VKQLQSASLAELHHWCNSWENKRYVMAALHWSKFSFVL